MNEAQAKRMVRDAFRQLDIADSAVGRADPELYRALVQFTERIGQLPDPAFTAQRQMMWKQLQKELPALLEPYTARLGREVLQAIGDESEAMEEFARRWLEIPREVEAGMQGARPFTANSEGITMTIQGQEVLVKGSTLAAQTLDKIEVAGKNVKKLFAKGQLSNYLIKPVEQAVTAGILGGQPTDEIKRQIITAMTRQGALGGVVTKKIRSQAEAVARTMVADATNRIRQEFWDANAVIDWVDEDGNQRQYRPIAGWEWDSSLDGRVCEQCLPLSGRFAKDRGTLPSVPVHVRCRCQVLPVSNTELALRERQGKGRTSGVELLSEEDVLKKFGKPGESIQDVLKRAGGPNGDRTNPRWRLFKTPVKGPDGERWFRAGHDLGGPRTASQWLAQATPATQQSFFGQGAQRAGAVRAQLFRNKLAKGKSPEQALSELMAGKRNDRHFIPLSKLGELPEVEPILSPRQARRRSSAKAS